MRGAVRWPGHGGALCASAPTPPFSLRALALPFSSSLPPLAFSSIILIPGACRLCSGKLQGCWHRVRPGLPGSGRAGVRGAGGLWDAAEADTCRVLGRWPQGWVPGGEQHGDSSGHVLHSQDMFLGKRCPCLALAWPPRAAPLLGCSSGGWLGGCGTAPCWHWGRSSHCYPHPISRQAAVSAVPCGLGAHGLTPAPGTTAEPPASSRRRS